MTNSQKIKRNKINKVSYNLLNLKKIRIKESVHCADIY